MSGIPAEIISVIHTGKPIPQMSAAIATGSAACVWSFAGGVYKPKIVNNDNKKSKKTSASKCSKTPGTTRAPRCFLEEGTSLYRITQPLAKSLIDTATVTSSSQLARGPDSEDDDSVQVMEDASAIEILNEAQRISNLRFKRAADDFADCLGDISSEDEEHEAVIQLSKRRQQKEINRLKTNTAVEFHTPQFLSTSDPFYNESTKNRGGRYKPSQKALSNQFG